MDHQARGWVRRAGFADVTGWTLTEAGRDAGGRMLAVELDEAGVRDIVVESHATFSTLNARFLTPDHQVADSADPMGSDGRE